MDTWKAMYGVIWAAFFQIIFVLFSPFGRGVSLGVHVVLALVILVLAFLVASQVGRSGAPARIKRIARTTWYLALVQILLGIALAVGVVLSWGSLYVGVISFFHVVVALAIITQASSSATAYDMWEEKEFEAPGAAPAAPAA